MWEHSANKIRSSDVTLPKRLEDLGSGLRHVCVLKRDFKKQLDLLFLFSFVYKEILSSSLSNACILEKLE